MPKANAFQVILDLPEVRKGQLDDLLMKGLSAVQVTGIIQDQWKIWINEKPATIKKRLERYRAGPLKTKLIEQVHEAAHGVRATTLAKRVNALDEMEELVTAQKSRYLKALGLEAKTPLLTKQVTDEGRLLKEMLVELGRLQLETGVLQRAPKRVIGKMTDSHGVETRFEWTQEQEELYKLIDGDGAGDSYVSITT